MSLKHVSIVFSSNSPRKLAMPPPMGGGGVLDRGWVSGNRLLPIRAGLATWGGGSGTLLSPILSLIGLC